MRKALVILISFILIFGITAFTGASESLFVLDEPLPERVREKTFEINGRIPCEMDVKIDGKEIKNPKHLFEKLITFEEMNQTKKLDIDVFYKSGEIIEQSLLNIERSDHIE
ncbi:MAG: hypothetical protein R2883_00920 [Caldisericia bacterium]